MRIISVVVFLMMCGIASATTATSTEEFMRSPGRGYFQELKGQNPILQVWDGGGETENADDSANWSDDYTPSDGESVLFDETSGKNCIWNYVLNGSLYTLEMVEGYEGVLTVTNDIMIRESLILNGGKIIVSGGKLVVGESTGDEGIRVMMGAAGILAAFVFWYAVISAA
jgi:hypothetical protein